jgi:hypothetical protein
MKSSAELSGLEADREYLRSLCEEASRDPFVNELLTMLATESVIKAGIPADASPGDREMLGRMMDEFATPRRMLEGKYIEELREDALAALGPDAERVREIPVGLLTTRYLNGAAHPSPGGGSVITFDVMAAAILQDIVTGLHAVITRETTSPLCNHHSGREFVEALVSLSIFCATGSDQNFLHGTSALHCPCISQSDPPRLVLRRQMKIFILLHEYGHVLLGHLNPASTRDVLLPGGVSAQVYNRSQLQEFEADHYALTKLLRIAQQSEARGHNLVAAVAPIIFMSFLDLVEAIQSWMGLESGDTHPPAHHRLQYLIERAGLKPSSEVANIPAFFASLKPHGNPINSGHNGS